MEKTTKQGIKTYYADECCVFRKTKEAYGGLSNMASGFPLVVNGVHILTSEALYQACRFPHLHDVQTKIIKERSPMSAKMVSKPFREQTREEWDSTRVKIMRWCLRVKLAQNFIEFGKLLESTFDKPIVEDSSKDDFWGAIRDKENPNILHGVNALGRLLMELRQFYHEKRYSYEVFVVEPLNLPNFNFLGHPIKKIDERENFITYLKRQFCLNESHYVPSVSLLENRAVNVENSPDSSIDNGKIKKEITAKGDKIAKHERVTKGEKVIKADNPKKVTRKNNKKETPANALLLF